MTSFDRMTPEQRSAHMAKIRGRDTRPERIVQALLSAAGVVFRSHVRTMPGTPDIVVPAQRTVVFVHGCFWHRHGCRRSATKIKKNRDFWSRKFARNVARDKRAAASLRRAGWRVMTVWECETSNQARLVARLVKSLAPGRRVCHDGPHVALPGRSLCAACQDIRAQAGAFDRRRGHAKPTRSDPERASRRRSLDLCRCGMPAVGGTRTCFACRPSRERQRKRFRALYARRLAEGRCRCGLKLAPGRARCRRCLRRLRDEAKARYLKRKADGQCTETGCRRRAKKGHFRCGICLKKVRAANRRRRVRS